MANIFRAGFARANITPEYPVPMSGYGNSHKRINQSVGEPIWANLVALSDGEKTVLLYNLDLTGIIQSNVDFCREAIFEKYGIAPEYIIFNASHTHAAPDQRSPLDVMKTYTAELREKIVSLVPEALADLSDAEIFIGEGRIPGYNFVRRYLLSNGTYGGDNYGDFKNNTILDHETEADNVMRVIRLKREEKKDIVLVNWQAHPHLVPEQDKTILTSDWIEHFRNTVSEENDVFVAFFQGCAGNINTHSRVPEENISTHHVVVGKALARGCTKILANMRPVKSGKIEAERKMFHSAINHEWDDRVEAAEKVVEFWKNTLVPLEAKQFALENGFHSAYHAMEVINRSKLPTEKSFNMGAISFGDVCFAWMPVEPYDTTGQYVRATSPFEMTFVLGYSNGYDSYMPTIKAFCHGGYECDTCTYPAGTTERMAEELIDLVVQVKR